MIERFGPWSSSLSDSYSPQLSTFWKRRLTRLASARAANRRLSRRDWLKLVGAGGLALALPTVQLASEEGPDPARAATPARIYFFGIPKGGNDGFDHANRGIYYVEPPGEGWTKISDFDGTVRVSRDGRTLALVRAGKINKDQDVPNVGVWTLDISGEGEPRKVADFGGVVSWSSESKQLIVTKQLSALGDDEMRHEAWRFNVDGTGATKLPIPATDEVDDWSPDGRWLVTVSDRHPPHGRGYQLYIMRPDGSEERRLTEGGGLNVYPRFSPDSRRIAYLHQERGTNSLWVVNIDGTDRHKLVEEKNNVVPDHLCWSPDGKSLAYATEKWEIDATGRKIHNPSNGESRLALIDADGKNSRVLKLPPLAWIGEPDWR